MNFFFEKLIRGELSYLPPLISSSVSFGVGGITPQTVKHHAPHSQDRNKYFILYIEFCINIKI